MADLSGERLGPFEIRSLIGTGGFATVYRAHDPRLDADVAIKILAENHALDPSARARFIAEAHALRRVDSPAVIRIHDIRETPDARPYLVLDLAERGDLAARRRSRVANGWTPTAADVRVVTEALTEALGAMHAEQLVHRDITPANLLLRVRPRTALRLGVTLLEPDEAIVVSDMGLVKDLSSGASMTMGGGTAGFWAPEQRQALTTVDQRTDIYAATAVVIWLLTGEATTTAPDWPRRLLDAGWPPALVHHLERGVALEPADRPASIDAWSQAIHGALTAPVAPPVAAPVPQPAPQPAAPTPSAPARVVQARSVAAAPSPLDAAGQPGATGSPTPSHEAQGMLGKTVVIAAVVAAIIALIAGLALLRGGDTASPSAVSAATALPDVTNDADAPTLDTESSSGAPDTSPTETDATATDADGLATPTGEPTQAAIAPWSRSTWALAQHPSGSQIIVTALDTTATRTRVTAQLLNGRDFSTFFRATDDDTVLVDDSRQVHRLLERVEQRLEHGDRATIELDFEPVADGTALTLHLNQELDADGRLVEPSVSDDGSPGFTVAMAADATDAPTPPGAIVVHDLAAHPNGTALRVTGVSIDDDAIRVAVRATNPDSLRVNVSSGHQASFIEDDLGNRYGLRFDGDNRSLRVPGEGQGNGTLVFSGRLAPAASSLTLVLNGDESPDDPDTSRPKLVLGPWSIAAAIERDRPFEPLTIGETTTHPNGLTIAVDGVRPEADTVRVAVTVDNGFSRGVFLRACCDQSYVIDDTGRRLLMIGSDGDNSVQVATGETVTGELVYAGSVASDATSIQLVFNADGDTDAETATPLLTLGPFAIERSPSPVDGAPIDTSAPRSTWVESELPLSQLD